MTWKLARRLVHLGMEKKEWRLCVLWDFLQDMKEGKDDQSPELGEELEMAIGEIRFE